MHHGAGQPCTVKLVGYADDLAIVADSVAALQADLDVLSAALAAAGLTISVDKTKWMMVTTNAVQQELR